jgi:hypothetical protein
MLFRAVEQLKNYFALRKDLAAVLAKPLRPEDCPDIIQEELAGRETAFVDLLERAVYANSRSPYLKLLHDAAINLDDIRAAVRRDGLESTLSMLRDAGVYLSFDEYKGRKPIERNGRTYEIAAADMHMPGAGATHHLYTGGSTGPAMRVAQTLSHQAEQAVYTGLIIHLWLPQNAKVALWRSEPPIPSLNALVRFTLAGRPPAAWFTPIPPPKERPSWRSRALLGTLRRSFQRRGISMPQPEYVPLFEAHRIAEWIAAEKHRGFTSMVQCNVSSAVRVCAAATSRGIDIAGARFFMISEPLTEAKRRDIEAARAVPISVYSAVDAGRLAIPCMKPTAADDMHVCKDAVALIPRRRLHPGNDAAIDSFLITTVSRSSPLFLLNVEFDDFGVLESRDCGCPLAGLGLDLHVSRVRSFAKLTAEGTTISSDSLTAVIEEALPRRFGGTSIDYQLLEEDVGSATRLTLVVSPRVGAVEERAVIEEFLRAVRTLRPLGQASRLWEDSSTLRVVRAEPILTPRGKLMPVRVLRDYDRAALPG